MLAWSFSEFDPNETWARGRRGVLHAAGQGWNAFSAAYGSRTAPLLMWINVGTLALGALADGSSSQRRFDMSAIIKSEMISRRKALSLMGLAAAFGLAAAPTVLTVSDAEAQTAAAQTAAAPTAGMERRQERRAARHERRQERRMARTERRQERR